MSHAGPTVTLEIYAHLMKPANPESASRLEITIIGTSSSKMVAKSEGVVEAQMQKREN